MEVQFRKYTTKDKEGLLEMMDAFYQIDAYAFDRTKAEKNLLDFINDDSLGRLFLIILEKELIGYFVFAFSFSFEYKGRTAFIDELYIKDEFRNKRIGKKALIFIEEEAVKLDVKAIHLEVELHNLNAKRLYLKHGFMDNNRALFTKFIKSI